jgi:hypothetical protein
MKQILSKKTSVSAWVVSVIARWPFDSGFDQWGKAIYIWDETPTPDNISMNDELSHSDKV